MVILRPLALEIILFWNNFRTHFWWDGDLGRYYEKETAGLVDCGSISTDA